uniref:Uncharacterized protein n=1 Tax=Triticum urartu TaxID=4572 RepID=A0A8R7P5L2_TRIUA
KTDGLHSKIIWRCDKLFKLLGMCSFGQSDMHNDLREVIFFNHSGKVSNFVHFVIVKLRRTDKCLIP